MNGQATAVCEPTTGTIAGYLSFMLGGQRYGLEIEKVRQIISMLEITVVPRTPEFIRGVVNLRGRVVAVVDLQRVFGLRPTEPTAKTCIVVVCLGETEIGILVDRVCEVAKIPAEAIQDAAFSGFLIPDDFIRGIGRVSGKTTILLDLDRIVSTGQAALAQGTAPVSLCEDRDNPARDTRITGD